MVPQFMLKSLELMLNKYIQLDPGMPAQLEQFDGKVLAIQCRDTSLITYLAFKENKISFLSEHAGKADTTISGTILSLMKLGVYKDADAFSLFAEEIDLSGDTTFAESVKHLFDAMDIDWEEHISYYTGDVLAHHLGNVTRDFCHWLKATKDTVEKNIGEYLQEESRCFPSQEEVEDFFVDIDNLRADVDRLLARAVYL